MDVLVSALSILFGVLVISTLFKSVCLVPQARARNVERLGKFRKTLGPGLHPLLPWADHLRPVIDLRDRVMAVREPVITSDSVDATIEIVLFYRVVSDLPALPPLGPRVRAALETVVKFWAWPAAIARAAGQAKATRAECQADGPYRAQYMVQDYARAVEKLTGTELRNMVAKMPLDELLISRARINDELPGDVSASAGRWGLTVPRIEVMTISLPKAIEDAMEDKRSAILRADGEAKAIEKVVSAINRQRGLYPNLLTYQYLRGILGAHRPDDGAEEAHPKPPPAVHGR